MTSRPVLVCLISVLAVAPAVAQMTQAGKRATLLGRLDSHSKYSASWGYSAAGREYAIVGERSGTMFVDVTDPTHPAEVAFVPGNESDFREIKTWGAYAYISTEGFRDSTGAISPAPIQVVDLSGLPSSVSLVNTLGPNFVTTHTLWIDEEGYLYANATQSFTEPVTGMRIFSLADPVHPVQIGTYNVGSFDILVHDIYVRNRIGFAAIMFSQKVDILDLGDRSSPALIHSFPSPDPLTHNTWLSDDGRVLGVTDEATGAPVNFYDVSNLSAPVLLSQFYGPIIQHQNSTAHNVRIKGDLAVISWYTEGVRFVDISDPTLPVEVGYYDTFPGSPGTAEDFDGVWDVYPFFASGTVMASDITGGLFLISFSGQYGILTGTVRDAETLAPLPGASVKETASGSVVTTGSDGRYAIDADPGTVEIQVSSSGYQTTRVQGVAPLRARAPLDVLLTRVATGQP